MKILFVTNNFYCQDGWSRYSRDLIVQLDNSGHEVVAIVSKVHKGFDFEQVPILEDPIKYLGNLVRICFTAWKIQKLVNTYKPDVVHFLVEPYVLCLPFVKTKDIKTVLTIHGTYSYLPNVISGNISKKIITWLYNKALSKLSTITADSRYTADYLLNNINPLYLKNISSKLKIITNGVDLSVFGIDENNLKKENQNIKQILFVGLIKPRKGLLETLKALSVYKKKYGGNFMYNVVGTYDKNIDFDDYYSSLLRYIKDNNLIDNVKFWGRVDQKVLKDLYKNADLFMMLSINSGHNFEGYGLVYLEANALGVASIGPTNCGAEDAIVDGKTGYLVNPVDSDYVAEKIHEVIDLGKISRYDCLEWAAENSTSKQAEKFNTIYIQ